MVCSLLAGLIQCLLGGKNFTHWYGMDAVLIMAAYKVHRGDIGGLGTTPRP